jgi:hypothetical protein
LVQVAILCRVSLLQFCKFVSFEDVLLKGLQMRSSGRKGWMIGVAALLVLGAGCTGFFVNQPNSITVTTLAGASTFTVAQGSTVQLQAIASFNSGS